MKVWGDSKDEALDYFKKNAYKIIQANGVVDDPHYIIIIGEKRGK